MAGRGKYTWLFVTLLSILAVAIGLPEFLRESEGEFHWSAITAFSAAFGLVGVVTIGFVARWVGRHLLQRDKDYYE